MKKNVAFTLISFAALKWNDRLSVQFPFEVPVQIPVQLHLELELNWLVKNVNELEFKLPRMWMKQTNNAGLLVRPTTIFLKSCWVWDKFGYKRHYVLLVLRIPARG